MALGALEKLIGGREARDADGRAIVVGQPGDDSIMASGSTAAAPAAGTTIATIAAGSLPPGRYRVEAFVWQSGTPDANLLNARVMRASTGLDTIPSLSTPVQIAIGQVTIDATGTQYLRLQVGTTVGGAGAIYNGRIVATRIG